MIEAFGTILCPIDFATTLLRPWRMQPIWPGSVTVLFISCMSFQPWTQRFQQNFIMPT